MAPHLELIRFVVRYAMKGPRVVGATNGWLRMRVAAKMVLRNCTYSCIYLAVYLRCFAEARARARSCFQRSLSIAVFSLLGCARL
jgi:hypothetical protein